jgi:hypothetical protein
MGRLQASQSPRNPCSGARSRPVARPAAGESYRHAPASEQRDCYRRAKRFLAELETALAVARHADLVSPTALSQLSLRIASVNRLLAGYLAFIERQVIAEAAVAEGAATRGAPVATRSPEAHGTAQSAPLPAA